MNEIEKIEYIDSKLPYGYEILIRNNQTSRSFEHEHKWFVHVYRDNSSIVSHGVTTYKNKDYYRKYGDNLNEMLNEAIKVVNNLDSMK
jgi:hypothetical protein